MKNLIMILILNVIVLASTGCGKAGDGASGNDSGVAEACADHTARGTWRAGSSTLFLGNNCIGTESGCGLRFQFSHPAGTVVVMDVQQTSGAMGCAPLGQRTCNFVITGNNMDVSCGGAPVTYTRQ